jgi:hypothetical protein
MTADKRHKNAETTLVLVEKTKLEPGEYVIITADILINGMPKINPKKA